MVSDLPGVSGYRILRTVANGEGDLKKLADLDDPNLVGPSAAAFPAEAEVSSRVGACPGREESAGESESNYCLRGCGPTGEQGSNPVMVSAGHRHTGFVNAPFPATSHNARRAHFQSLAAAVHSNFR